MTNVRSIEPADRDPWLAMRCSLWPDADPVELADEVDRFLSGAAGQDHLPLIVLVAVGPSAAAVGFLELSLRSYAEGCAEVPVPYVEAWWVHPDHRGNGHGRALMAAAEAWGIAQGHRELASDALLDNPAGQSAHRAVGFVEVGRSVQYRKPLRAD